jgi:hypothetical protein
MDFGDYFTNYANNVQQRVINRAETFKQGQNIKIGKYAARVINWFIAILFFGLFFGFVSSCMAIHAGAIRDDSLGTLYKFCGSIGLIMLIILLLFFIVVVNAYLHIVGSLKASQLKYRATFDDCLRPFETCWNQKVAADPNKSTKPSFVGIFYSANSGILSPDPCVVEIEMDEKVKPVLGKPEAPVAPVEIEMQEVRN